MTAPTSTTPDTPDLRPVVALDIDGVLNVNGLRAERQGRLRSAEIHLSADDIPDSPFVTGAGTGLDLTIRWDPEVIDWLCDLAERAHLVWATTWEHAANSHFAPLVGLPRLDVIEHSATPARFSMIRNGEVAAWKIEGIEDRFGDRPVIWVDDSAWGFTHCETWWVSGAPLEVIAPDPDEGITAEHRARIEAFVAAHPPAGS